MTVNFMGQNLFNRQTLMQQLMQGIQQGGYNQGFNDGFNMGQGVGQQQGFGMGAMLAQMGLLPSGQANQFQSMLGQYSPQQMQGMTPGCFPQPRPDMQGPPAGQGLKKNPGNGFPDGSVRTAGGYTVVPDGNTSWKIFGPDQKSTDTPITHVSGDPHVAEKDGTHWDFTKNSDFVLPDGTRINAKTSAEKGYSVTTGLEITNGADHVSVTGVDHKATTGDVTHDGYEWRAQHIAENPSRDTFRLGGDGDDWFLQRNGKDMGEVTGAHMDAKTGAYEQSVDGKPYQIDRNLRPPFGSDAWGNMLRNESLDRVAAMGMDPETAKAMGQMFHQDHSTSQFQQGYQDLQQAMQPGMFGGMGPFGGVMGGMGGMGGFPPMPWGGQQQDQDQFDPNQFQGFPQNGFRGPGDAFAAVAKMSDALNSLMSLQGDLALTRAGNWMM